MRIDIHRFDLTTQLLFHAIVFLSGLFIGAVLSFDVLFAGATAALFKWISAFVIAKLIYFVLAYLLFGESFVDPLEKLYEGSRER